MNRSIREDQLENLGWTIVHERLNHELPVRRRGGYFFWWAAALLLLIAGGAWYFFCHTTSDRISPRPISHIGTQKIDHREEEQLTRESTSLLPAEVLSDKGQHSSREASSPPNPAHRGVEPQKLVIKTGNIEKAEEVDNITTVPYFDTTPAPATEEPTSSTSQNTVGPDRRVALVELISSKQAHLTVLPLLNASLSIPAQWVLDNPNEKYPLGFILTLSGRTNIRRMDNSLSVGAALTKRWSFRHTLLAGVRYCFRRRGYPSAYNHLISSFGDAGIEQYAYSTLDIYSGAGIFLGWDYYLSRRWSLGVEAGWTLTKYTEWLRNVPEAARGYPTAFPSLDEYGVYDMGMRQEYYTGGNISWHWSSRGSLQLEYSVSSLDVVAPAIKPVHSKKFIGALGLGCRFRLD